MSIRSLGANPDPFTRAWDSQSAEAMSSNSRSLDPYDLDLEFVNPDMQGDVQLDTGYTQLTCGERTCATCTCTDGTVSCRTCTQRNC